MSLEKQRIRLVIIVPVILALLLLAVFMWLSSNKLVSNKITRETKQEIVKVNQILQNHIELNAKTIHGLIDIIKTDKKIQSAWLNKDRKLLQQESNRIYDWVNKKYNITHFYFHQLDGVNFLRMHNPTRHGDKIDRFTLKRSAETQIPCHGIELGIFGTFTLRVVHPWFIDKRLAGFIELGEDIDRIAPELEKIFGLKMVVTISKKHLDEKNWLEGQRMIGTKGDWNKLKNSVIFSSAFPAPPEEVLKLLNDEKHEHHQAFFIKIDNRIFSGGLLDLHDASGKTVGDIFVAKDFTDQFADLENFALTMLLLFLLSALALVPFFYFYLGRIESRLQTNIKEKDRLISELQNALAKIKSLSGLLPICAYCKKIKDDHGYWKQVESYIDDHSEAEFTHGICPQCAEKLSAELDKAENDKKK
ncbi:MAG: hypothetical protein KAS70_05065 [Planctomycetes bacterium]|nr:hypothetical protein [Planctomycetota bacterium]MCK5578068.1 hypothetical protein [Planctomycetota bacterium]